MSSIRDQSNVVPSTTDNAELDDFSSSFLNDNGREDSSSDDVSDTSSMSPWNFIQENSDVPYFVPNGIIHPIMQYGNFNPIPVISTYWIPSFALGNPSESPLLTWQWQWLNVNLISNMWYYQRYALPLAPPFINQIGFPPVFFPPWYGPSPYHVTYGQHGSYFSSPSTYVSGHHLGRLEGQYYTSQFMEDEAATNHWPMFEPHPQHIVDPHIGHQMHLMQAQAPLMPPVYHVHPIAFGSPTPMLLQDMHHDMRLDIDSMSYEELLALEEQIGDVSTGLREETIMELLKRRYHIRIGTFTNSDEPCSICRDEYVHGDEIGELNCGHEFHIGCIKQWLIVKNTCPICKMKGLGT